MSLSSALYTGTSGLTNTSNALQVTSNNISNSGTVGFKKGTATFADTLYDSIGTQSGTGQVGLGTSVGNVSQNFSQGSMESTGNATDLSIGGDGFFVVSQPGSDEMLYTRAGNFSFDDSGALVNPSGYVVQGWNVDPDTGEEIGAMTDLILDDFNSPPKETEELTVVTNLDADAESNSGVLSNSYTYEAGETTAVSSGSYEYQTVVKAYDSLGSSHDITIMYDKVSETEWEYIVVCNPEEDKRELVQGTESQGLLSRGSIEFSESSGKITNITMEEFTGRVGNVETGGMNSPDDIHFEVADGEAMPLDGYGLELSFDGNGWVLDPDSIPENYPDAQVVYSDDQNVHISLDPNDEGEADLKLKLDKPAMAGDTIGFDINDPNETHIQNLKNVSYGGGASENTHMEINDPNTMTRDAEGCGMVWNPVTEQWQWSNPEDAAANGSLVSDMVSNGGSSYLVNENTVQITNPTDMTQSSEDIGLRFDDRSGQWYWNEPLKTEDFTNPTYDFVPENNPTVSVVDPGTLGAVPSLDGSGNPAAVELEWDGTQWSVVDDGGCQVEIIVAESNASQVQFRVTPPGQPTTEGAVVQYSFDEELSNQGGQSLSFEINPTPPEEYANAQLTTSGVPAGGVGIDFNNNGSTDLIFDTALGTGAAPVGGDTLSFSVDPDVPPEEYPDAVIKGDENRAIIDLDGSGNEDDIEDIVFTFDEKLKTGTDTHPLEDQSYIQFDIEGSTAWREVPVDEAEGTGYFQFTADFLGGDNGSTEMDISLNLGSRYDGENFVNDPLSTTQYSRASSTTYQDSDGYPPGDLTDVSVNADGVVTGSYSNGQQIPLFRVALADFNNENGLYSQGGNLFSATNDSGPAITNKPGENGLGSISPNTLEMSNVDITEEFTSMISLQRAFEANSTVITTVDSMMSTVIQMK